MLRQIDFNNKKPIIAVDIDDTLTGTSHEFIKAANEYYGKNLEWQNYDENWAKMYSVSQEEMTEFVDKTMSESGFYDKLKPFEYSKEALGKIALLGYDLKILTARNKGLQKKTEDWITKNFPNIFSEVVCANLWNNGDGEHRNKGEFLKKMNADFIVDDQPKHLDAAFFAGIRAVSYGNYPWQNDFSTITGQSYNIVCEYYGKNWKEIEQYFTDFAKNGDKAARSLYNCKYKNK